MGKRANGSQSWQKAVGVHWKTFRNNSNLITSLKHSVHKQTGCVPVCVRACTYRWGAGRERPGGSCPGMRGGREPARFLYLTEGRPCGLG